MKVDNTMYDTYVLGEKCRILWLEKRFALRALIDSYAKGLPPTFKESGCLGSFIGDLHKQQHAR